MKIIATYLACITTIFSISAQYQRVVKADKEYNQFAYVDAIKMYERIYSKGHKSVEMLQKLGDSYYFNADLESANKWYNELFSMTNDLSPEYYYRYAQSLKAVKNYEKADAMMDKFDAMNSNDQRAKLAVAQKDYLSVIKQNSGRYLVEDAGINTKYSDFGSSFYKDKIVFSSARNNGKIFVRKYSWTGEPYTNLYKAVKDTDGNLSSAEIFSKNLNSRYHESTPAFSKDGKTVYFTRNNYLGKKGVDDAGIVLLKIYKATLVGDKWENVTELPFNSNNYSVAHPALSPDEKFLYFASNMPGTKGQSDIFRVAVNPDGSFGQPENMGEGINTEGRETFPFLTADNELYFASDGHPGLGGLDVFVAMKDADGNYKNVMNVGEGVNSSDDDFAFLIDTATKTGYVTSNRTGGKGKDDIYKFKELKKIEPPCEQYLTGVVTDKDTGVPVEGAKVVVLDKDFNVLKELKTDSEGKFDFGQTACDVKYFVKTEKPDYQTVEIPVYVNGESGKTNVPVNIEKTVKKLSTGDDIAKVLDVKMIFFDLDKSDIRPDAIVELSKVLYVMEQNPNIKVDIRSHTDSRNTAEYNLKLSERRAKSTKDWLVKNGIDSSRLTAKGYGESQLLNNCSDGVPCSDEEHQKNRRSEFIIVK